MDYKTIFDKQVYSEIIPYSTPNPNLDGYNIINGSDLRFTRMQRSASNNRPFSHLYSSFNLPLANFQQTLWPTEWGNTALSGFNVDEAIVVEIPKNEYGELIDGRTIKLTIPLDGATTSIDCYTSYFDGVNVSSDPSIYAEVFGHTSAGAGATVGSPSTNVSFLFSDFIKAPTDPTITSWADSWTTGSQPFGYPDGGQLHNFDNLTSGDKKAAATPIGNSIQPQDEPIGICYLDKGFCVITHPELNSLFQFSAGTNLYGNSSYTGYSSGFTQIYFTSGAECSFFSFEKQWVLDVECRAEADEFFNTHNPSAADLSGAITINPDGSYDLSSVNKPAYVTEIGLYDTDGELIALAKPDRPIQKFRNEPAYFNLKFRF
mgnify:CR=1 FL=1|tara:strand:+ start:4919 stop:6043 length:1125 start_codon:yes stop_codon:yes gene_type:complete